LHLVGYIKYTRFCSLQKRYSVLVCLIHASKTTSFSLYVSAIQPAEGRWDTQRSEFKVSAVNRTHIDMTFSIWHEVRYLMLSLQSHQTSCIIFVRNITIIRTSRLVDQHTYGNMDIITTETKKDVKAQMGALRYIERHGLTCVSGICLVENLLRNESSLLRGGFFWMVVIAPESCTVVLNFIHLWLLFVLRPQIPAFKIRYI